ncbi:uncharacterized protein LOC128159228 [Crassostrea angulata]|uniref:uncharacterized protein LOC128159228 n=1 Tax=Magallana angulata TaxID=2784310 RepID=UPI0022B1D191|nr:uncharacterized protein LOC128159228 [Crassostrea angulata]
MREKTEAKLKEIQNMDIIEPVEGPSSWVRPIAVTPKQSGDIRLCVDMTQANEAIIKERHPIPTIDEILNELNGSYSLCDKNALHVSGRCYWKITEYLNFFNAHKRCQAEGGILAEIPDQEAQTEIMVFFYLPRDIWIGVNDIKEEGKFVNMLNETVSYTNWDWTSGEPNNKDPVAADVGDCVRISHGRWFDTGCFRTFHALCSQRHNIECKCPCAIMKNRVIIKNEAELLTKIDNMKKELTVNKSLLSSSIRKRTSAVDPRPSASIVGGTISVVIIATFVGFIALSDLTRVINFCWKTILKRWNNIKRATQEEKV